MKIKATGITTLFFALFLVIAPYAHAQNDDVSSTLEIYKITTNDNGEEVAEQVTATAPGDTIEYRLIYTNNLSAQVTNLQANLPVPEGMQYMGTARPQINAASLQPGGDTFQALPIQREETLESGLVVEREVPVDEYRRLRWTIPALGAEESVTLTARVQVINEIVQ